MFTKLLLSSAALALIATGAYAHPKVNFSGNHRMVSVEPGKASLNVPNHVRLPKGNAAFDNYATAYPNGLYFCCYGYTISGPSSVIGESIEDADGFTAPKSGKVTHLSASANYVSGGTSFTLTLYADSGSNTPGAVLASGTGTSSTSFGACCGTTDVTVKAAKLSAGSQYWLGVSASGAQWGAWAFSTTDQVDDALEAYNDAGAGWGSYSTNLRGAGSVSK